MFSKRPRRDKILVAITGLVAATAVAVPLALIFGNKQETRVDVQPKSTIDPEVRTLVYRTKYATPASPKPAAQFVLGSTRQVVTASPVGSLVGRSLPSTESIAAGTSWSVVFTYVPASGYVGDAYTHTINYTVIPLEVTATPVPDVTLTAVAYGQPRPSVPVNDFTFFPQREGYERPVFVSAVHYLPSAGALNAPAVDDFTTVGAGETVQLNYEMRTTGNYVGDPIAIKVRYPVVRAKVTAPASAGTFYKTVMHGIPAQPEEPTAAQKAALVDAGYRPYVLTITALTVAPGLANDHPPTGTVIHAGDEIVSFEEVYALQAGSTVRLVYRSVYDQTKDRNHTGDATTVTYEYVVNRGNFGPDYNG